MAACKLLHSSGRVASSWQGNRHAVCRAFSPRQQHFNSVRRQLLTSGVLLASTTAASAVASKQPALAYADRQLTSATNQPWDGDISSLQSSQDPPTIVTAPGRMVAIGDLHGDWDKTVRSLVLAGVLSVNRRSYKWVGGDTVVVQLGDVLDRGTSEIAIMLLLWELDQQARKDGGAVYMLNGNHESLNICQNYSYVDVLALAETIAYCELFEAGQDITVDTLMAATAEKIPEINPYDRNLVKYQFQRYRSALFQPGGPLARLLSVNPTVLMVNDTVFAHGGVLPVHVNYGLYKLNAEVAAWMRGDRTQDGGFAAPPFLAMGGSNSVMWTRMMSTERQSEPQRFHAKSLLKTALARLGAERLVVGHTPQVAGINADLDDKVWRVDVGMSSGVLDAPVQVLEILPRADGEEEISVLMEGMPLRSFDELGVEVDI